MKGMGQREGSVLRSSVHRFCLQMTSMAGAVQSKAESPELLPGLPPGGRGPTAWHNFLQLTQVHWQGVESELVQLELELELFLELLPIWDDRVTIGGLICCAIMPASSSAPLFLGG